MTELASQLPFPEGSVLLHELNHRINNEFASAISAVSLAAALRRSPRPGRRSKPPLKPVWI
jgi:hypothetical protein